MTTNTKILLFVGGLALVYYLSNKRNKKPRNVENNTQPQDDSLKSSYNIVPLPDIKGYTFSSIPTARVIGQTTSSPIIIARPM